ncbi:MAG: hypothetical protein J5779_00945 [Clostridia bacterium]|nr:hypothetical protein [Clostridia bacterium]
MDKEFNEHVEAVPCNKPFVVSKEQLDRINSSKPNKDQFAKYEGFFEEIRENTAKLKKNNDKNTADSKPFVISKEALDEFDIYLNSKSDDDLSM